MDYREIVKPALDNMRVKPHLGEELMPRGEFDWALLAQELGATTDTPFNLTHLAIDRHAISTRGNRTALLWEGKNGEEEQYSFRDLVALTSRFANVLSGLGVAKGDRVFTYMERLPELYVALLGGLKLGAVVGPLFADFGPDPVRDRLLDSGARVLVTTPGLRNRISSILGDLPTLEHVIVVNRQGAPEAGESDLDWQELMAAATTDRVTETGLLTPSSDHQILDWHDFRSKVEAAE